MELMHTPIPGYELQKFDALKDIKIVFDVGSRADVDYIRLKPDIELHAFEPNPFFFHQLSENVESIAPNRPNTYLNNFGLGDVEKTQGYNTFRQAFTDWEEKETRLAINYTFPIKTLDWYVEEHAIDHIDFLKIDVEGYDFKVLQGGTKTIPKCHYIQYEYWNDRLQFHNVLEKDFEMLYFGGRNVLCTNKLWL